MSFATLVNANNFYNTHFYGSTLWSLQGIGKAGNVTPENILVTQEDADVSYRTRQRYTTYNIQTL